MEPFVGILFRSRKITPVDYVCKIAREDGALYYRTEGV